MRVSRIIRGDNHYGRSRNFFVGTMYGNSLLVAEEAEAILSGLGHKATVFEDPEVKDWESYTGKYVLVVTSTTGQGDLPDSIVPLYEGIKDMYQPHLRYGIIALGDSTYANFCGGGKTFDALLQEQGRASYWRDAHH